jgi:hypothetical protein
MEAQEGTHPMLMVALVHPVNLPRKSNAARHILVQKVQRHHKHNSTLN